MTESCESNFFTGPDVEHKIYDFDCEVDRRVVFDYIGDTCKYYTDDEIKLKIEMDNTFLLILLTKF